MIKLIFDNFFIPSIHPYALKVFQWNQKHSRRCHSFEDLDLIKEKNQTTLLKNIKDNYKQHLKTQ